MELIDYQTLRFHYRFGKASLIQLPLQSGLYLHSFRGRSIVLSVDSFGEVRISLDTPVANPNRLARELLKTCRTPVSQQTD